MLITGTHDAVLVVLSVLVAIVASYTALDLAGRVRVTTGRRRLGWLATAAVAMGGGIWSMHFVAMLAFSMPGMEASYEFGLTALSLAVAIVATGAGFLIMAQARRQHLGLLVTSGVVTGLGVAGMHYIGMAAMRMPADLDYDRLWVVISIFIAVGAATAAVRRGLDVGHAACVERRRGGEDDAERDQVRYAYGDDSPGPSLRHNRHC